jgi:hypothetical protein
MRARERERRVWEFGSPHIHARQGGEKTPTERIDGEARSGRTQAAADGHELIRRKKDDAGLAIANFLLRILYMEPDSTESNTKTKDFGRILDGRALAFRNPTRRRRPTRRHSGSPARARLSSRGFWALAVCCLGPNSDDKGSIYPGLGYF